ncbi:MAG: V-type ATP synthase subunit D [Candidatus Marinimicrobia bacterium]|nr:V-type ATP synthase subunit D [Candidatus Neomarinimicrobiota bacterium]
MAKIKHTKNELKAQRDALARFERYLPTLTLKKQQLQMEVRQLEAKLRAQQEEADQFEAGLDSWIGLFTEAFDWAPLLEPARLDIEEGNVAGVNIPILQAVEFGGAWPDAFDSAAWLDDGIAALRHAVSLQLTRLVLEEALRRLREELRVTTQRVNLFEKVKIPECREHIRVIRIFLGDQQTADVVRGKIAKKKTVTRESAA